MKSKLLLVVLIAAIVVVGVIVNFAQDEGAEEIPQLTITVLDGRWDVPDELPEGLVTLIFENYGEAPILPVPSRLKADVTQDDFLSALEEGGQDAALGLLAMLGGTFVWPESPVVVTYDFTPGEYALVDFALDEPAFIWFTVADEAGEGVDIEIEADYEVHLMDFAFHMPLEIEAGEHLWHIENTGGQWHEMGIMRVADDVTLLEVREMMFGEPDVVDNPDAPTEGGPAEDPGPMPDFMWIPMEAGEQAWLHITLEPGTYVVGCMLPNLEELEQATEGEEVHPHMHAELGMLQLLVVK